MDQYEGLHINFRFAKKEPDHIMSAFCGDAKHTVSITWRTDTSIADGYLEYHEQGSAAVHTCKAVTRSFTSDVNTSHIHSAQPTDLKPGTKYVYTCGNDTYRSAEYTFVTEEENCERFTFLMISDHQKEDSHTDPDYMILNRTLKRVLANHPEVRFILTAGDNCNCGQHEIQWNAMFEGLEGIIESVPYMMCCGNHDNRGFRQYFPVEKERYYAEPAEFFNNQFKLAYPQNGPEGWQTENYSFDYGNVHFSVYGVNEPTLVNEWSMNDLDKTSKTWKLGVYHFPIYPSIPMGHNFDAYPMMRPCMERQDIMFAGHEHNFARTFPMKNENMYDRPSQGTVHYMLGNSHENASDSKAVQKLWHSAFNPQSEKVSMFTLVNIDGRKLTITGFYDDGRIVDVFTIDKDKDEITPYAIAPTYRTPRTAYKGYDLGLAAADTPPERKDGVWFLPFGTLAAFIGGTVIREKDRLTVEFFGHKASYTCGSSVAETDAGSLDMGYEVYRGARDQLYIPIDGACKPFKMTWTYADRNNYINIQNEDEGRPAAYQP